MTDKLPDLVGTAVDRYVGRFSADAQNEVRDVMNWFLGREVYAPVDGKRHDAYISSGTNDFIDSVRVWFFEKEFLTEKQFAAVKKFYSRIPPHLTAAERPLEGHQALAGGNHVGEVGERMTLALQALSWSQLVTADESPLYHNVSKTVDGDIVVCDLSLAWTAGNKVRVRARILDHIVMEQQARTVIDDVQILDMRQPRRIVGYAEHND